MSRVPRGESLDRVVAAGLVLVGQVQVWAGDTVPGPKAATVPLVLLITAAIAYRRRAPLAVGLLVLFGFAATLIIAGSVTAVAVGVAWICAVYGLAVWTETRDFLVGCGAVVVTSILGQLQPHGSVSNGFTFIVIPCLAMLIARRAVRDRELRAQAFAARAELLERERELHAREAVTEERERIARELHDLVAHHVSVMVVQAGAERHALGDAQPGTREVLGSIEQAGRQALAEARRLLGMLRRKDEHETMEPQPGIAQVDILVEQVQRAGLPVTLAVEGDRVALPAGVDLCAYRVIQEGLTNVLKHAGPARANVRLRYEPDALDVEVRDDGRGSAHRNGGGAGHGLIGMRERVGLYGGELETGPGEHGGFAVHARIPLA